MSANVNISIVSPHGGRTIISLNPDQVSRVVDILDGHPQMRDQFGEWFVEHLMCHDGRRP